MKPLQYLMTLVDLMTLVAVATLAQATRAQAATNLSACQPLQSGITYSLTQGISSVGASCLDFSGLSNVVLNCNGHSISTSKSAVIVMDGATNITMTGCKLKSPDLFGVNYIIAKNVNGFTLQYSTVGNPLFGGYQNMQFVTANNVKIIHNSSLSAAVQIYYGTNSTISSNTMTSFPSTSVAFYPIELHFGSNNYIQYNTIDGKHDPSIYNSGSDDGIALYDETADHISYNTISNVYDAGIEMLGVTKGFYVHDNKINNAVMAGISSYYWTSMTGSKFAYNTVTNSGYLFSIYRIGELRAAGFDYLKKMPADTGVYFENNIFENNTLLQPNSFNGNFSAFIPVYAQMGYTGTIAIPAADFHIANNTFIANNFTATEGAPDLGERLPDFKYVSGYITDGGGNVCGTQPFKPYPLACQ